jgi:hypothetical protein
MMSVKISEKNREAFSALRKKSINTRLTEQYPKLLQTVHSKASEKEKVQTVYKFITLLEELVDEIDTTNIRS